MAWGDSNVKIEEGIRGVPPKATRVHPRWVRIARGAIRRGKPGAQMARGSGRTSAWSVRQGRAWDSALGCCGSVARPLFAVPRSARGV